MEDYFGPRYVDKRDIPGWVRETWALFRRRALAFLGLAAAFYFLAHAARTLGAFALPFSLLLCQIALFAGIVIAEAADTSRKGLLKPTYAMIRNVLWMQLLLALVYVVLFIIMVLIGAAVESKIGHLGATHAHLFPWIKWLWPGLIASMCLYSGVTILTLWLLAPLLALHELGLRASMALARRGEKMNVEAFFYASYLPYFCYGLLLIFLDDVAFIIGAVLLPLFAPYQYVVYRHIFLGRKQNKPLAKTATAAALSAHSA
ncbi:MAG TPA: hypothetical protein VIU46_03190 [Gallionellaceae bacterium]